MKTALLILSIALVGCIDNPLEPGEAQAQVTSNGGPWEVAQFAADLSDPDIIDIERTLGINTSPGPKSFNGPATDTRGYRVIEWEGPAVQRCEGQRRPPISIDVYENSGEVYRLAFTKCHEIFSTGSFWYAEHGNHKDWLARLAENQLKPSISYFYVDRRPTMSDGRPNSDYGTIRNVTCFGDCSTPPE